MFPQMSGAQNRKFVCFIYPIYDLGLDWQSLKDYVRRQAPAPNVTRVEVPRSMPSMGHHGWVAVKGFMDAENLWRLFTNNPILGCHLTVHLFDTTQRRPELIKTNAEPGSHWCAHCLQFPVSPYTSEFLPDSPPGTYDMGFQQHIPNAGRLASRPTINTTYGARVSESRGIFISNLSAKTTGAEIHELMVANVGKPTSVQWRQNQKKTHATVEFATAEEARQAIAKFDGYMFKGWKMGVRHDKNPNPEQAREGHFAQSERAQTARTLTNEQPIIVNGSNQCS